MFSCAFQRFHDSKNATVIPGLTGNPAGVGAKSGSPLSRDILLKTLGIMNYWAFCSRLYLLIRQFRLFQHEFWYKSWYNSMSPLLLKEAEEMRGLIEIEALWFEQSE